MPSPFPCSPVIREWLWKKTKIEKKKKDKRGIIATNAFQRILKKSNRKPNKVWVDTGSGYSNWSMKSWLEENNIEMHIEGKPVAAGRFIRTLKN